MPSESTTANPRLEVEAKLQPHHIKQLRDESGLSEETIIACRFRSENRISQVRTILQHKTFPKKCGSCLVIPYFDSNGNYTGFQRLRPDTPRKSRKDGRPIKYESPRKSQNRAYFPPHISWRSVIDEKLRIFITEGEKKSAKAMQEGFPTIGLAGIWNWKPDSEKADCLIPDLEVIDWSEREVVIIFDSDVTTNQNIQDAESRLAKQLAIKGAKVRVARLPAAEDGSKVGLDDYLVSHSVAELHQIINAAGEPEDVEVFAKQKVADLDAMEVAREFLKACAISGNKKRMLHFWRDEWYAFNRYVYRKLSPSELRARVIGYVDTIATSITTRAIGNILDCLRSLCIVSDRFDMPSWRCRKPPFPAAECLVTKNGVIHLPTMELRESDPDLLTVNAVDFNFDPTADCPEWIHFLSTIWSDDPECIDVLQDIFGYLLLPDTSQQKIFLMVGPKRSGKGTIGRIIRELIGRNNVCAPTLGRLAGEFGLQPLLCKTAAIVGDARLSGRNDASAIAEALLSISGEDPQTVNRKHLPQIDTQLSTRFLLLTNELPRFNDASATLPSRFIILKFTKSFFGREDHSLTDKLKAELPGILNWSIEGYKRLNDRGFFIQPASADEAIEEMEELSSPITAFLRDCCDVEPGAQTLVEDVWAAWRRWSARTGRKEGTKQTFGRDLRAAAPGVQVKQTRAFGGRVRIYEGLRITNPEDDETESFYS